LNCPLQFVVVDLSPKLAFIVDQT